MKASIGKLEVPPEFYAAIGGIGVAVEPFDADAAIVLAGLPLHHRDPFDRMLIAQAISGGSVLVSTDPRLKAYDVTVLW